MRSDVLAQLQSPVNNKELIPAHACSIQGLEERAWERTGPGGGDPYGAGYALMFLRAAALGRSDMQHPR